MAVRRVEYVFCGADRGADATLLPLCKRFATQGSCCSMGRGKAVWNENLGAAVMTGEFVRFPKKDKEKNYCGQIVDIKHYAELPALEQRNREWHGCTMAALLAAR